MAVLALARSVDDCREALAPASRARVGGLAPFILWEAFSIIYYGFAFPNSAYAKLTTGVPWRQLMVQGEYVFGELLAWDPVTLFGVAVLVGFVLDREARRSKIADGLAGGCPLPRLHRQDWGRLHEWAIFHRHRFSCRW